MFKITEKDYALEIFLTSEAELGNRVIDEVRSFMMRRDIEQFAELKVILRELLANAREHGNGNNPHKLIYCSVDLINSTKARIIVEDQGSGFNTDKINLAIPENPRQLRHRGLPLIKVYSLQMLYNETGNRATVFVKVHPRTTFQAEHSNDFVKITPSGNVTSSSGDELRTLLLRLTEQGVKHFEFDFIHVEDIDSIALSLFIVLGKQLKATSLNKRMKITNANQDLYTLFTITRLTQMFTISCPHHINPPEAIHD